MNAPIGTKDGGDRQLIARATEVAAVVAQRGLETVVSYMESNADDLNRALELSAQGVAASTQQAQRVGDAEITSFEKAVIDFVDAVAPRITLAAARIITGNTKMTSRGPRRERGGGDARDRAPRHLLAQRERCWVCALSARRTCA